MTRVIWPDLYDDPNEGRAKNFAEFFSKTQTVSCSVLELERLQQRFDSLRYALMTICATAHTNGAEEWFDKEGHQACYEIAKIELEQDYKDAKGRARAALQVGESNG
jgi:hypothetical protein